MPVVANPPLTSSSYASPFVTGAAAVFIASKRGQRLYQSNASPQQRVAAVRAALMETKEATHLPGDPDQWDEGVINLRRF
jgi:hypothetical protein